MALRMSLYVVLATALLRCGDGLQLIHFGFFARGFEVAGPLEMFASAGGVHVAKALLTEFAANILRVIEQRRAGAGELVRVFVAGGSCGCDLRLH